MNPRKAMPPRALALLSFRVLDGRVSAARIFVAGVFPDATACLRDCHAPGLP